MCSTAAHLKQTTPRIRLRVAPLKGHLWAWALVPSLIPGSLALPRNSFEISYLAAASLLPMGSPGTKCKNPPSARSTIIRNRAVHSRNAHGPPNPHLRAVRVAAARHSLFCDRALRQVLQSPQTIE